MVISPFANFLFFLFFFLNRHCLWSVNQFWKRFELAWLKMGFPLQSLLMSWKRILQSYSRSAMRNGREWIARERFGDAAPRGVEIHTYEGGSR